MVILKICLGKKKKKKQKILLSAKQLATDGLNLNQYIKEKARN